MSEELDQCMFPDNTSANYQKSDIECLMIYGSNAIHEAFAKYRFVGLLAGFPGEGQTEKDVENARAAVMEAISDILNGKESDIHKKINDLYREVKKIGEGNYSKPYDVSIESAKSTIISSMDMGHPTDTASYTQEIADGLRIPKYEYLEKLKNAGALNQSAIDDINRAASLYKEAASLELQRRKIAAEARAKWWSDLWSSVTDYFNEKIRLIKSGHLIYAVGTTVIDAIVFIVEEVILNALIAVVAAATAIAAPAVYAALKGAIYSMIRVVRIGPGKTVQKIVHHEFKVEVYKLSPTSAGFMGTAGKKLSQTAGKILGGTADILKESVKETIEEIFFPWRILYALPVDVRRLPKNEASAMQQALDQANIIPPATGATTRINGDGSGKSPDSGATPPKKYRPDKDMDELKRRVGDKDWELAASNRTDIDAQNSRKKFIKEYEEYYGIPPGGSNASSGFDLEKPVRLTQFPPPDKIYNWNGIDQNDQPVKPSYGNYYDPKGGSSPDQLGVNSVGRRLEEIDVNGPPRIALEGYGGEITDGWSVVGGPRKTNGGPVQLHIPNEYKPDPSQGKYTGVTWRDLPGNKKWVEAEKDGLLVYERRGTDQYAKWHYDGPPIEEIGGYR